MTPFEYVIVLISIILGLGITTILTGVAELIKHTSPVRLYAPYIIWILLVFVLHIQDWWVSYELKSVEVWELPRFLLIILYPINLYILAHLLFPAGLSKEFDSKIFYLDHFPRLFYGSAILILLSTVQNISFTGLSFVSQAPKLVVAVVLLALALLKVRSNVLHLLLSGILLASLIVGLAIDKDNLVIK
jgi:hypothetical protein